MSFVEFGPLGKSAVALAMASRSDSGNDTRGSSESDNSPTPTPTRHMNHPRPFPHHKLQPIKILPRSPPHDDKILQQKHSITNITSNKQLSNVTSSVYLNGCGSQVPRTSLSPKTPINTKTTPISRTTPTIAPMQRSTSHSSHVPGRSSSNYPIVNARMVPSNQSFTTSRSNHLSPPQLPSRSSTANINSNNLNQSLPPRVSTSPNSGTSSLSNRNTPTNCTSRTATASTPLSSRATPTNPQSNRTTPSNTPLICRSSPTNIATSSQSRCTPSSTPVSRNPAVRPITSQRYVPMSTAPSMTSNRAQPFRPLPRRPPNSGMGSSGSVHTLGLPTPLSSLSGLNSFSTVMTSSVCNNLASSMGCAGMGSLGGLNSLGTTGSSSSGLSGSRGRQRNSVAVVDSRDHIYEELDIRGPPKLTPISGVLPQGKVVIRPIAYRPAAPSPAQLAQGLSAPSGPIAGVGGRPPQDPRYNSTPALPRGTAPHYGSLGDLKSLGYSLDRRGLGTPLNHTAPSAGDPSSFSNPQGAGTGYLKHASLTHLHHVDHQPHSDIFIFHQNSSKNNGNSSSIYSNTNTGSLNHSCDSSNLNNTHTNCDSLVTSPRSLDNSNGDTSESPCDASPVRPPSQHKPPSGYSASTHDSPDSPPVCLLPSKQTHSHQIVYSSNSCPAGQGEPTSLQITNSPHNRTSQSNIQRYDNAKNYLPTTPPNHCDPTNNMTHSMVSSSNVPSSGHHQHHYHHLHHHHHRMGGSVSNLSRLSAAGIAGSNVALDRSASVTGANLGLTRSSVNGSMTELDDPSQQTPSPSDSGVAELEAILKEKDSEISLLKESMEQSEQIIFKVYEEKEKTWERELKKIRDMYEARLKASQQKITSLEQSLNSHAYQVQQERRKVSAEAAEARRERDAGRGQQQQLQQTIGSLRSQLEETEWGLCQKSGEISLLKSQLKDVQGDQTSRGHELLHLRAQLRQYAQEVERRRAEIASLHELTATLRKEAAELRAAQLTSSGGVAAPADGDADQLRKVTQELMLLREERVRERERITEERSRWQQEKESVLRYQRQLQLACQHAQRTNRRLQHEMARLHGETQPTSPTTPPPAVPPLPPGYNLPPSPLPPPPGVLSEEALC
ncbi:mucin-17 isoform X2 [Hyalella azteca]|uniref:Mucin-17 isoform X2 n=1 Tax=Hyalella azteca TaxID=294128 RepID=A0A8B7P9N9_HYAAZ|nr:mucin-17 isoform X2 [Hyalella azteca]